MIMGLWEQVGKDFSQQNLETRMNGDLGKRGRGEDVDVL